MGSEQFWRDLIGAMRPQPTTARPAFVTAAFVDEYGPLPGWLHPSHDVPRDGYYIGIDTPETRQARIDRLRATLKPFLEQ